MYTGAVLAIALLVGGSTYEAVEPPPPRALSPSQVMADRDVDIVESICVAAQSEYMHGNKNWMMDFFARHKVDMRTRLFIIQLCTFYAKGQLKGMTV